VPKELEAEAIRETLSRTHWGVLTQSLWL
jgi:hypothetical protein